MGRSKRGFLKFWVWTVRWFCWRVCALIYGLGLKGGGGG